MQSFTAPYFPYRKEGVSNYHDYETNLITFPAIPLPPMAPEVTDWSEHHMKLSWKEPIDDGGAAVTGYHVEAKSRYAHSRRSHVTKSTNLYRSL